jgi:hypothetical protein
MVMAGQMFGKRPVGKPKKRWIGCRERRQLPNTELEKLGGEGKGQRWMEVKDQKGQGPFCAAAPLLMIFPKCALHFTSQYFIFLYSTQNLCKTTSSLHFCALFYVVMK